MGDAASVEVEVVVVDVLVLVEVELEDVVVVVVDVGVGVGVGVGVDEVTTAAATGAPSPAKCQSMCTRPAEGSAIWLNAAGDKSKLPYAHSGHKSTIVTVQDPLGPVIIAVLPQAGLLFGFPPPN